MDARLPAPRKRAASWVRPSGDALLVLSLALAATAATGTPALWLLALVLGTVVLLAVGAWVAHQTGRGLPLPSWRPHRSVAPGQPGGTASRVPASEVQECLHAVQLGASILPLLARCAEPTYRLRIVDTTPVVTIATATFTLEAAVADTRIVAIRGRYPSALHAISLAVLVADMERFLPPELPWPYQHRLTLLADGWLLATLDCPVRCQRALGWDGAAGTA